MTLLVTGYKSKKELKAAIGKPLQYQETSMVGAEYKANGTFTAAHRPAINRHIGGREFFAVVTMRDGKIAKVE